VRERTTSQEARQLEQVLRERGSPDRAGSEKAYLKVDLEFAGLAVPVIRSTVRTWVKERGGLSHDDLIGITQELWTSDLFEARLAAEIMLEGNAKLLRPADLDLIEHFLRHSGTWALIDGLAANVAGELAEQFPAETEPTLDRWAGDQDFWIRRSALLALLRPLRRGGGDFERFARYADLMLDEREFFIRKAIGWVLRETAKRQPDLVAQWLAPRLHRVSGITIREAVKPLAPPLRDQLLAGYREKRPLGDLVRES
jgi:3-methyladenine DNA glycosylase AlkD